MISSNSANCYERSSSRYFAAVRFYPVPLNSSLAANPHTYLMENPTSARSTLPCDQCRQRKVRCSYGIPCDRCKTYDIGCTFVDVRKKRGPKRGKGAVIERLRAESRSAHNVPQDLRSREALNSTSPGTFDASPLLDRWQNVSAVSCGQHCAGFGHPRSSSPQAIDGRSSPQDRETELKSSKSYYLSFDEFAHHVLGSASTQQTLAVDGSPALAPLNATQDVPFVAQANAPAPARPRSRLAATTLNKFNTTCGINDIIGHGLKMFFAHIYPIYPVLDEFEMQSYLAHPSSIRASDTNLLKSTSALALMLVDNWPGLDLEQRAAIAWRHVRQCLEARINTNFIENATFADVLSSLFIAITHFELKNRKALWFYLRESITLAHIAGLHSAGRNPLLSDAERVRQQRTYAILFITERGASVLDSSPVTLLAPPGVPEAVLVGENPAVRCGLCSLHSLFELLDFNFGHFWNSASTLPSANHGFLELSRLQNQLCQQLSLSGVSDTQKADILITQQWLRLVFWQVALKSGLISSTTTDPAFSYEYPVEIASTLSGIVKGLPPAAIQMHGLGIFEKQFEIAYSLLDAVTLSGAEQTSNRYETLRYLLLSLSASPNSRQIFVRTLQNKIGAGLEGVANQKYRRLAGVELRRDYTVSSLALTPTSPTF